MPTFQITAPDGKKYKVTGATREGALNALKNQLNSSSNQQTNQQPTQNQNRQQSNEQQSNKVPYLKGLVVNSPVRGWIGMRQGIDSSKAAQAAKKAGFWDVNSLDMMKRAAQMRMSPQMYQKVFESEECIE